MKQKRSETGRPLTEVARITRIKESYLKALEEEEFDKLPIEVYTRGYIREYAKFLGVDPEEALASYERYLALRTGNGEKTTVRPSGDAVHTRRVSPVLNAGNVPLDRATVSASPRESVFSRLLSHKRVAWVLPAVLAVLVIYSALPTRKQVIQPTLKLEEPAPVKSEQLAPGAPEPAAGPAAGLQAGQGPGKEEIVPGQGMDRPHRLDIVATDKVWLQVVIDGSEKRDMLLNQGDRVSYRAARDFTLKIGNAGGLRLVFDQKELDNLGNKGQVISLKLPDNGSDPSSPARNNLGNRIVTPSEASQP